MSDERPVVVIGDASGARAMVGHLAELQMRVDAPCVVIAPERVAQLGAALAAMNAPLVMPVHDVHIDVNMEQLMGLLPQEGPRKRNRAQRRAQGQR